MIRNAIMADVPEIHRLITHHAELNRMLFRSHGDLYEHLRDFFVYVDEPQSSGEPLSSGEPQSSPSFRARSASEGPVWDRLPAGPNDRQDAGPTCDSVAGASGSDQEERPAGSRSHTVLGCAALELVWRDLAEIKSLAVDEQQRGRGIGRQLVAATIAEARRLGLTRVFALTREQAFFEKLAFRVVPKETLPHKVWTDCVRCPLQEHCDETAVIVDLT